MNVKMLISLICACINCGLVGLTARTEAGEKATSRPVKRPTLAQIGKQIFLDKTLSQPQGQGCVSCHQPQAAFADPRRVSPGAVTGRIGRRNSPSLMYAALIPPFAYDDFFNKEGEEVYAWEGGMFHDGRARDLFEQVQQPFFDRNEMNLPNPSALAKRLRTTKYADQLRQRVGDDAWVNDSKVNYYAYRALVEFLKEPMFRPFDARIDDYFAGDSNALSKLEQQGLTVFKEAGMCADCHFLTANSWDKPLLSDYGYDNLGVPSRGKKDPGLGARKEPDTLGQFRAPTLRNIALTAPYMHNGSIATLRDVIEFYNKRDLEPKRWGPTDYPKTVNHQDMGNLGLTDQQVNALIAVMDAFTDRSLLKMKPGQAFPKALPSTPTTLQKKLYFPDWTHRLHPEFPGKTPSKPTVELN